jgi:hypothetical protein
MTLRLVFSAIVAFPRDMFLCSWEYRRNSAAGATLTRAKSQYRFALQLLLAPNLVGADKQQKVHIGHPDSGVE